MLGLLTFMPRQSLQSLSIREARAIGNARIKHHVDAKSVQKVSGKVR